MKITVTAKPNSKQPGITKVSEMDFIVAVGEPPVAGRANRAIAQALTEYFGVSLSRVNLVSGFTSRHKTFEIY